MNKIPHSLSLSSWSEGSNRHNGSSSERRRVCVLLHRAQITTRTKRTNVIVLMIIIMIIMLIIVLVRVRLSIEEIVGVGNNSWNEINIMAAGKQRMARGESSRGIEYNTQYNQHNPNWIWNIRKSCISQVRMSIDSKHSAAQQKGLYYTRERFKKGSTSSTNDALQFARFSCRNAA